MSQTWKRGIDYPEFLTEEGLTTLKGGYLLDGETPMQMYARVAHAAASNVHRTDLEAPIFEALIKNWICLASPVAANTGTTRGLPISCFGLTVSDSVAGISTAYNELMMMAKGGGGVGVSWSGVRGRGAKIAQNGVSNGTIPWIKVQDSLTAAVNQGSVRNGASSVYMSINHPDIEEFIRIRRPKGDPNTRCHNIHHAVVYDDAFMQKVELGDPEARKLWMETIKMRKETGEPYQMHIDNVNRKRPKAYVDNNLYVTMSQLCVTGDARLFTASGYVTMRELWEEGGKHEFGQEVPQDLDIVNSFGNSMASRVVRTSESAPVFRVVLGNGTQLKTTAQHTFKMADGEFKALSDIKVGDYVALMSFHHEGVPSSASPVASITSDGNEETFCVNEPANHEICIDGVLTGNCSEIMLFADDHHSFVCCLSSMNLARYHEWKGKNIPYLATWLLDGVMQDFINKAEGLPGMEKARRFAVKSRALGLGGLGWHSLLQAEMTPFNSLRAKILNKAIWKEIREDADRASQDMAKYLGEVEWTKGLGERHTHKLAIAPTTSNATMSSDSNGHTVSFSIEPWPGNIFTQKSAKGTFVRYNPMFTKMLEEHKKFTPDVIQSVVEARGSVQHLSFLTDEQREVFKTAYEIDQFAIIEQAADRQEFLDQGQSLNLFFKADVDLRYFNAVHLDAYKKGLFTLYYVRSESPIQGDTGVSTKSDDTDLFTPIEPAECTSCEG